MTFAMIQVSDVPKVKGNPETVETAGTELTNAANEPGDAASALTTKWAGLTKSNYNTPESPAVFQSMPKITAPMDTIGTNLTSLGSAVTEAGTTLGTLKTRAQTLKTDVEDFVRRANDMDDFAKAGGSLEGEVWSTWRDAPGLQDENNRLWHRATTLQTDIDTAGTDLQSSLASIFAPNPVLPDAGFEAGVPSGNRGSAEGPGANASTWSGSTFKDGNFYFGAGAEADAHLFDLNAEGSVNTHLGTFAGSASLYGGARADAAARASIGVDGLHAQAEANAFAGVEGKANASWDAGPLSADVGVRGMAGAEANAKGALDIGPDGVSANAGVKAFAGAKAEADATVGFSGAEANVGADVRAGIGFEAEADVKVTSDEVKVKLNIGASLGIGAGIKVDFSIKPKKVVDDIKGWLGF